MRINRVIDRSLIFLCYFLLLVDSINGYILLSTGLNFSISQIYKSFIIFLMVVRIMTFSRKHFLYLFILLLPFFLNIFIQGFSKNSVGLLVSDIIVAFKVIFIFIAFFYFYLLFKNDYSWEVSDVYKIIFMNFAILVLNMVVGGFGFGYSDYFGGVGTSGFFYAGNEVSGVMILFYTFICHYIWNTKKHFYLFICCIMLVLAVLKATKVAIIGSILVFIFIPVFNSRINSWSLNKIVTVGLALFFIPVLLQVSYFLIVYFGVVEKYLFDFETYDLVTAILSNRNNFAEAGFQLFMKDYTWIEYLFGIGQHEYIQRVAEYGRAKTVEIDILDIFFQFGMLGLLSVLILWYFFLKKSFLKFLESKKFVPVFVANLLLFSISVFSGHVMNSGMNAIFIGLINGFLFIKYKKNLK